MQTNLDEFFKQRKQKMETRQEESKSASHGLKPKKIIFPMAFEKYWKEIKKILYDVAFNGKMKTKSDFLNLIQTCIVRNYLERTSEKVDLRCLNGFLSQLDNEGISAFLYDLAPFIAMQALQIDSLFDKKENIDGLTSQIPATLEFTRGQLISILSHCFLCSFPAQKEMKIFQFEDFYSLFSGSYSSLFANKIMFLINYFAAVKSLTDSSQVNQIVKFTRIVLPQKEYEKLTLEYWLNSTQKLLPMQIIKSGGIEDCPNSVMVDFANKYLGGGVLEHGAVQEEILFLLMPELLITRFMCDKLSDNEAILAENCALFSNYSGYSSELRFEGQYTGSEKYSRSVIAIDALPFANGRDQLMQFSKKPVLRELNKAFIGFNVSKYQEKANVNKKIATGRWGCGAFRGNAQLKLIIQWLAGSECQKNLVFHCYEDVTLEKSEEIIKKYQGKTVGELFAQLINFDNYFYDTLLKDNGKSAKTASEVESFDTLLFKFLLSQP